MSVILLKLLLEQQGKHEYSQGLEFDAVQSGMDTSFLVKRTLFFR